MSDHRGGDEGEGGVMRSSITQSEASLLASICGDNDLIFMHDYSGRWMYGKHCIAIVYHNGLDISYVFEALRSLGENDLADQLHDEASTTDNMAGDWIVYWPNIEVSL